MEEEKTQADRVPQHVDALLIGATKNGGGTTSPGKTRQGKDNGEAKTRERGQRSSNRGIA